MARGASNKIKAHLFALNASRPNALGGKRTNFWSKTAKSTSYQGTKGEGTITIAQLGFRQRLEGGPIKPRKVTFLTIPAAPEAHGRRAREFNNLTFGFAKNKFGHFQPALIEAAASGIRFGKKRKTGQRTVRQTGSLGGKVMYFLTQGVVQSPDPSVLPPVDEILKAATDGADEYLRSRGGAR